MRYPFIKHHHRQFKCSLLATQLTFCHIQSAQLQLLSHGHLRAMVTCPTTRRNDFSGLPDLTIIFILIV